ncbi:MAG: HAD-IA family hydrolase, partial [Acidimicrobiia bacterium]
LVESVFTSARIGYEKPHPEAFRTVLSHITDADNIWMVGDNPVADVAGAEKVGIPGILVRTDTSDESYLAYLGESFGRGSWSDWANYLTRTATDLSEAAALITAGLIAEGRRLD